MAAESVREVRAGSAAITYTLRRSLRRHRTIQITVGRDGQVRVAAPQFAPAEDIDDFVRHRARWIFGRMAEQRSQSEARTQREWCDGETLLYLGAPLALRLIKIDAGVSARVERRDGVIEVPVPARRPDIDRRAVASAVEGWYRRETLDLVSDRVGWYAEQLGARPTNVLVRSQTRRWGSCSRDGTLRFNWRLSMAPLPIVDYVVVHELCHLRHPNHRPEFWRAVGGLIPDYQVRRAELRRDAHLFDLGETVD